MLSKGTETSKRNKGNDYARIPNVLLHVARRAEWHTSYYLILEATQQPTLHGVCCTLHSVCCTLHGVMLHVAQRMLHVARRMLHSARRMLHVARRMLHVARWACVRVWTACSSPPMPQSRRPAASARAMTARIGGGVGTTTPLPSSAKPRSDMAEPSESTEPTFGGVGMCEQPAIRCSRIVSR